MKSFAITKDESNMIKGIAIILMMIHHFWSSMQPIPVKIVVMGGANFEYCTNDRIYVQNLRKLICFFDRMGSLFESKI